MKYMGSKNRIYQYILPIILRHRKKGQIFYDVCCGGGNIIDKIKNPRIGIDVDEYVIEALKLIRDNPERLPKNNKETNEQIYEQMKTSSDKAMKGYYGYALSYGGKWFGGWCRDSADKRDYIFEAYKNALWQSRKTQGAEFIHMNLFDLKPKPDSVLYVDPPYKGTTGYRIEGFDYEKFWDWVDCISDINLVFISEYQAPDNFKKVWSTEICSSLTQDTGLKKATEYLFVRKDKEIKSNMWG